MFAGSACGKRNTQVEQTVQDSLRGQWSMAPGPTHWMHNQRDPVSEWFDAPSRALLHRVYARQGEWVGQYLAPPSARARARLALLGIDPWERDRWGEVRWVRAFKRSVYFNLKKHGYADGMHYGRERLSDWPTKSLEWQTGARVRKQGWPQARWAIRLRLHPTGASAHRAALVIPDRDRWIDKPTGRANERQSTTADREWLPF
jgi:hypothetical protein